MDEIKKIILEEIKILDNKNKDYYPKLPIVMNII